VLFTIAGAHLSFKEKLILDRISTLTLRLINPMETQILNEVPLYDFKSYIVYLIDPVTGSERTVLLQTSARAFE